MTTVDLNNPLSLLGGRFQFAATMHAGSEHQLNYSFPGIVQGVLMVAPGTGYPVEILVLEDGHKDPVSSTLWIPSESILCKPKASPGFKLRERRRASER